VELAKRAIDLRFWYDLLLTAVEVLDGFSSEWGASSGDIIANASALLYLSPGITEGAADHTKIFFSYQYAQYRPNVLGSSLAEQMLKDYNGQTYWLSVNLHSFYKGSKPKWLNLLLVMEQTEC
jgi:hypothetical protein